RRGTLAGDAMRCVYREITSALRRASGLWLGASPLAGAFLCRGGLPAAMVGVSYRPTSRALSPSSPANRLPSACASPRISKSAIVFSLLLYANARAQRSTFTVNANAQGNDLAQREPARRRRPGDCYNVVSGGAATIIEEASTAEETSGFARFLIFMSAAIPRERSRGYVGTTANIPPSSPGAVCPKQGKRHFAPICCPTSIHFFLGSSWAFTGCDSSCLASAGADLCCCFRLRRTKWTDGCSARE
ncbi:MAG TPA: hypothetical protein VH593_25625, partial [Ktedonobacteraceae bacterium]